MMPVQLKNTPIIDEITISDSYKAENNKTEHGHFCNIAILAGYSLKISRVWWCIGFNITASRPQNLIKFVSF